MRATVYTDASFHPRSLRGGWAVWAVSDLGRIIRKGACPQHVASSYHAEGAAVFAGVYLALKAWPSTRIIRVCTDCKGLVRDIGLRHGDWSLKILGLIPNGVTFEPTWIKGHRDPRTGRSAYVNDRVDQLSREARITAENRL